MRLVSLLVILLLGACFYLEVHGLPLRWSEAIRQRLQELGYQVGWSKLRLRLFDGVVIENFNLFAPPRRGEPLLHVDRVILLFNPQEWLQRRLGLSGLRMRNGTVRIPLRPDPAARAEPARELQLTRIEARVEFHPHDVRLQVYSAFLHGIRLNIQGSRLRPSPAVRAPEEPALLQFAEPPPWLTQLDAQLAQLRFLDEPVADVRFLLDPAHPQRNTVTWSLRGGDTLLPNGAAVDYWKLAGGLRQGQVSLEPCVLNTPAGQLRLDAHWQPTSRTLSAHIVNSLPLSFWTPWLPPSLLPAGFTNDVVCPGPLRTEVWLGPAQPEQVAEQLRGWVALDRAEVYGVALKNARVSFQRQGPRLVLPQFQALVGRGRQQGPASGQFTYDSGQRHYSGRLEGAFDPRAVLPWLSSNQAAIIRDLAFPQERPGGQVAFSGYTDRTNSLTLRAELCGTNFTYCGAAATTFHSTLSYTNWVLAFSSMHWVRPEGELRGRLALDLDRCLIQLDLQSTVEPGAVALVVGPVATNFLSLFRIEGPVQATARGQVDYSTNGLNAVQVDLRAARFGLEGFLADEFSGQLAVQGYRVELSNLVARAYGGTLAGATVFEPRGPAERMGYDARLSVTNLDFGQLVLALGYTNGASLKGELAGQVALSGLIGPGAGPSVLGQGEVRIGKGHIFQIPLLGGLSKYLGRIYPGLGFAAQNDFSTAFSLTNSQVQLTNAELLGPILSVKGHGAYGFDGRLDFRVQVHPLREGMVAEALRLVTMPVSKLLEFQLSGTAAAPRWRPVNPIKELRQLFSDLLNDAEAPPPQTRVKD